MTLWLILGGVGIILGAAIYFHRAGRREGAAAERNDAMQEVNDDVRKAQEARRVVDAMSDAELDERVSKWTRK